MIPKIIHYCWFGGNPLPASALKCIESWKKYLPDYEIKEWNESNFDVNVIPYTAEAYKMKKYAFVSDYARFYILYKFGGLYFDTDVQVINNMDDIVERGPFMGCENLATGTNVASVAPGLGLGVPPGHSLYKEILDMYDSMRFINEQGVQISGTVVTYTTDLLVRKGLVASNKVQCVDGVWIYPKDYFCPMDYVSGITDITSNTRSIHLYTATWKPWYCQLEMKFCQKFGIRYRDFLYRHVARKLSKS